MSVYSHFLARGRDVIYPKDMSMLIGLGIARPRSGRKRRASRCKALSGPFTGTSIYNRDIMLGFT